MKNRIFTIGLLSIAFMGCDRKQPNVPDNQTTYSFIQISNKYILKIVKGIDREEIEFKNLQEVLLERCILSNNEIAISTESMKVIGTLNEKEGNKLYFTGKVSFSTFSSSFNSPVTIGESIMSRGGAGSGVMFPVFIVFENVEDDSR